MSKLRPIVVLLLLLWLPLQPLAAVAMPFCQHSESTTFAGDESAAAAGEQLGHHAGPSGGGHKHHADAEDSAFSLQCNDCGPCHLACAPAIGVATGVQVPQLSPHLFTVPQRVPLAHTLEQLDPPPLA